MRRLLPILLLLAFLFTGRVHAHPPENGIYPTYKGEWEVCCDSQDCIQTSVEVRYEGHMAHVRSGLGDFTVLRSRVKQITNQGAEEHVCVFLGGKPRPDGKNVMCVFVNVGLF